MIDFNVAVLLGLSITSLQHDVSRHDGSALVLGPHAARNQVVAVQSLSNAQLIRVLQLHEGDDGLSG